MSRTRRTRQDSPGVIHPLFWALLCDDVPLDDPRRRDPTLGWRWYEWETDLQLGYGHDHVGYIRAMWDTHKDYILRFWAKENPGTRPQSFWRFEVPDHSEERGEDRRRPTIFGPPSGITEIEYLDRHGLLTENERRRLPGVAGPSRGASVKIKDR